MRKLLLILLFSSACHSSEYNLVVPFATAHVDYGDHAFNNNNYGLGLEYKNIGVMYIDKDSYSNKNYFLYYDYKIAWYKGLSVSVSNTLAFNYDKNDITYIPVMSYQYQYFRVSTSFPFGKKTNVKSDVFNAQIIIPFT